ncbi:MAG: ABC transporter permease [Alphaproteobacteria bacterium]|nr:ABC transporter permease [Alphaproteobacteria bacterium SS10]
METLHSILDFLLGWALDVELIIEAVPKLAGGLVTTAQLMGASLAIGMVLALLLAGMRLSGKAWLNGPAYAYVFFFRGTPLLVQIFLIYYGLAQFDAIRQSDILWPIFREPFYCAVFALSLNTAAYTAEIIRGGIMAVPPNEVEAARAIGMSRGKVLRRIMIPHAMRVSIPAYANEVILLLKGSALVSAITILDIAGEAQRLYARTYAPFEPLIAAGLFYLAMTYGITKLAKFIEFMTTPAGKRWWRGLFQHGGADTGTELKAG